MHVANAPCSWGVLEHDVPGGMIGYRQMLDELAASGYTGTELGDWGYMPTDPAALRSELHSRRLTMLGAFVGVALDDPDAHAEGEDRAVRTARLLAAVAGATPPVLVLADANGGVPMRIACAGRITPEQMLPADRWPVYARGVERVARAVLEHTGLRTVFHPHCAGWIETPDEIARLLELTDPALLGLCYDTGHYTYGGGDALDGLRRFGDRLAYVHFKDCSAEIAARARADGWDYQTAVRHGVFCELGQGTVDFPATLAWLRRRGYDGWITVEQDVLAGMGTPKESAARNREYLRSIGV
jgi:inosose dehydratase